MNVLNSRLNTKNLTDSRVWYIRKIVHQKDDLIATVESAELYHD